MATVASQEHVQVVLKPLGGGGGEVRRAEVLQREFAAVADSWIATVSVIWKTRSRFLGTFLLLHALTRANQWELWSPFTSIASGRQQQQQPG